MTDDNLLATLLSIASSARPTLSAETIFASFPQNQLVEREFIDLTKALPASAFYPKGLRCKGCTSARNVVTRRNRVAEEAKHSGLEPVARAFLNLRRQA